jgi:lysophospholipase L1-like esterase
MTGARRAWLVRGAVGAVLLSVVVLVVPGATANAVRAQVWVAAWTSSPQGAFPLPLPAPRTPPHGTSTSTVTVREFIHPSVRGDGVRVRLTNEFGATSLSIVSATLAAVHAGAVQPGTLHALTVSGRSAVAIPPGGSALTDLVPWSVDPSGDLAVSLAVRPGGTDATENLDAQQRNLVAYGNRAWQPSARAFVPVTTWPWVSDVEVRRPAPSHTVVAFGDSLTSGLGSRLDANDRWPDLLARRLGDRPDNGVSIVDAGIAGNELLASTSGSPSALSRLAPDALDQPGVRTLILLEGVNDLDSANPPNVVAMVTGYRRVVADAHADGVRVVASTLLPFGGYEVWTPGRERERDALNRWITTSGAFDGVVNLAAAVADPAAPARLAPRFDSGDHLHLNDAGYGALAAAIPLRGL